MIYSSVYCLISLGHEEDDEVKSCATGALTGLLYKSSAGIKRCASAGAFGLGIAATWAFLVKKNQTVSHYV